MMGRRAGVRRYQRYGQLALDVGRTLAWEEVRRMARWVLPLDPDCPEVRAAAEAQANDPMWAYAGIGEEWWGDFKARHVPKCERCREYGCENVDVE